MTTISEEERLRAWIRHLRNVIANNPEKALDAFRALEELVGVGGAYQ